MITSLFIRIKVVAFSLSDHKIIKHITHLSFFLSCSVTSVAYPIRGFDSVVRCGFIG